MRQRVLAVVCVTVFVLTGCGGDGPTGPSGPALTGINDLVGEWGGTVVTATELCYPFTWNPTLGGPGVTAPVDGVGTMTGALSGDTVSLTMDFPAGSFGPNACAVTGSGVAQATQTEMTGKDFRLTFTPACVGVALPATTNDFNQKGTITLRKRPSPPPACPAGTNVLQ